MSHTKESVSEHDEEDPALSGLPGAHVNGAAAYHEGERRRQEMLEVAESLLDEVSLDEEVAADDVSEEDEDVLEAGGDGVCVGEVVALVVVTLVAVGSPVLST